MTDNFEKQSKLNKELSSKLIDAEKYGNTLRKKLSKIDLPAASLNKPEETQQRINDAKYIFEKFNNYYKQSLRDEKERRVNESMVEYINSLKNHDGPLTDFMTDFESAFKGKQ